MSPIIPSRYGHPKYNRGGTQRGCPRPPCIQRGTPGSDSKSRRKQRITVEPTEDEEADNFYSKQLAAARFQRNHRLINILFSEVVVNQDQSAENDKQQQMNRIKRIKSLEEYKDKINKEIVELEEKFNAKKVKITQDGKNFTEKLNEFTANSKQELEAFRAAKSVLDGIIESI